MNKKNVIKMYRYFSVKELFENNSQNEIVECVRNNSAESLLFLLQILDSFRDYLEFPIRINSGYRDVQHNKIVGGVPTSQHLLGEAIDFSCKHISQDLLIDKLQKFLKSSPLGAFVGQVIFYNTFIHIALRAGKHQKIIYYDKRTSKKSG